MEKEETKGKVCRHIFLMILFYLLDIVDFINDWLQYNQVTSSQEGLVYGVFGDDVQYSLLVFCIIGTVFFMLETVSFYYQLKGDEVHWDYIVLLAAVWLEDVPQIMITAKIAACRQDAISAIQLAKAVTSILEALIELYESVMLFSEFRKKKEEYEDQENIGYTFVDNLARFCTIPGLVLVLFVSSLVFFFSNFSYDMGGSIHFLVPKTMKESKYETKRYVEGVAVFLHIDMLYGNGHHMMAPTSYIKVANLDQIGIKAASISVRIQYDHTYGKFFLMSQMTGDNQVSSINTTACYNVKKTLGYADINKCSPQFLNAIDMNKIKSKTIVVKLEYRLPNEHQILGDIVYNYRTYQQDFCEDSVYLRKSNVMLKYFKFRNEIRYRQYLKCSHPNSCSHFYRSDKDLIDIKNVWKTGYLRCPCTARDHPKYDQSVKVPCFKY